MNARAAVTDIGRCFWFFLGVATFYLGARISPAVARPWSAHDPAVYLSLTFMAAGLWFCSRSTGVFYYEGSPLSHILRGMSVGWVILPAIIFSSSNAKNELLVSFVWRSDQSKTAIKVVRLLGALVALCAAIQIGRVICEMALGEGGRERLMTLIIVLACTIPILSEGLIMLRGPINNAFARIENGVAS